MRICLIPVAALLLSGCIVKDADEPANNMSVVNNITIEDSVDTALANVTEVAPAEGPSDNEADMVPVDLSIPAAFQGRWGLVEADCDPARADNKGLMTVTADTISFYESRAKVQAVSAASPQRFEGDFAFSGEGETWAKHIVFSWATDGKSLVRSETDPQTTLTYHRCPA